MKKRNQKIVNHKEKTIRFGYYQLTDSIRKKVITDKISPYELRLINIKHEVRKGVGFGDAKMEYYLNEGYKVVFHYFYKDYLLIFNR